jgi:hypothetical protein
MDGRHDGYSFDRERPGMNVAPPGTGTSARPARTAPKPADMKALDELLQLLARAVMQFHTYPPTSTMCQQAVDAFVHALVALESREQVTFRIAPRELIVEEEPTGRGTIVEQELARRLHAALIAEVTIERTASAREIRRLCEDLVRCGDRSAPRVALIDLLTEHGVDRISLRPAYRPEVLSVAPASDPVQQMIDREQERREEAFASGGPVNHLYPPGKGWIRVDPSARLATVSLIDLALLADDPAALAGMLIRLTDDDTADAGVSQEALSEKYSEVATLFAAMDPRLGRVMFAKLARAVLDLDSEHRQALLKKTILPGLLDGRMDGAVLRDFPDLELADSLCLLLDLEAAAPEVVTAALARLELPAERHAAMIPLLEQRVQTKIRDVPQESAVDTHARRLVRIDRERAKSLAEFTAFDLAVDDRTRETLTHVREGIAESDVTCVQLDFFWKLTRLEPNPETIQRFATQVHELLQTLDRDSRWAAFAAWTVRFRELADALVETRPDVAEVLREGLSALCTAERAARLVAAAERDPDEKTQASAIIVALGAKIGPPLLSIAQTPGGRAASHLILEHAALLAPALAEAAERVEPELRRVIARALGLAGPRYETTLGSLLKSPDEQTVREALRALARIGTPEAARLVAAMIHDGRGWIVSAAEQTLWHFPKAEAERQVIGLLSRREFVVRQPHAAERLMDRAPREHASTAAILRPLQTLRYRIWNPALARIGRKARARLAG